MPVIRVCASCLKQQPHMRQGSTKCIVCWKRYREAVAHAELTGTDPPCTKCGKPGQRQKGGGNRCITCLRATKRAYRKTASGQAAMQRHEDKQRAKDPNTRRRRSRTIVLRRYGMTPHEFDQLVAHQKGCCAICMEIKTLEVDHCHQTQRNRRLLCHACNFGLGAFRDSPIKLASAIAYIERETLRGEMSSLLDNHLSFVFVQGARRRRQNR